MQGDEALLEADRASRAAALDVARSAIVQAPAGSGKTELLIQRYLGLLGVVSSPEEILAITFTRKAAHEMRNRVLAALRMARDGEEPVEDYERTTYRAAGTALARDRANGWHIIESPSRMRIQTVDAFGSGIARVLPLSSGLGGIATTVSGAEMNQLYRSAATATLDSLSLDHDYGAAVERVLLHLDNRTGLYVSHLARMLAYRDQWLGITGGGFADSEAAAGVRRRLERNIARIVARQLREIRSLIPGAAAGELLRFGRYAAANLLEADKPDHALCALADTRELPSDTPADRRAWQAVAALLLTGGGDWRKRVNRNDGFPPQDKGEKDALYALIADLRDIPALRQKLLRARLLPPAEYVDEQWQVLLALLKLLPLAVVELRRLFGMRGVADHIEVALSANQALGTEDQPGDIALALDYSIRHLLVDEMQDTSISQYGLLRKLTLGWTDGDGRTMFCVGDPMQSIYRFRNAEVGQFLLAREQGIGGVQLDSLLLRRNFRSGENLVHWFNTVFAQVFPDRDDLAAGAIAYSASIPVAAHAGSGSYTVHPLFGQSQEEEATHTLGVIQDCLERHPGDKLAVLVRSRTTLPALLYELRLAGINYQAVEIDRLTDLPEIIDLLALTRALCHEGDRLAWLAVLRGPCVGLNWTDLHTIVRNDVHGTIPELLADADRMSLLSDDGRRRAGKFLACLARGERDRRVVTLRDCVESAWYALGGPWLPANDDQLDNVYRFFDVIDKIESGGNLADFRELERVLDQERASSTADADCRVQIMTMHKAKGLQFDHVVLHGLGRTAKTGDKAVLSWTMDPDGSGNSEMILSPIGPQTEIENDPLHQFIETLERDKERFELDRLLYVSCTRAIKSLHLIGNVGLSRDRSSYSNPPKSSLLYRLWPAIECEYADAFAAMQAAEPAGDYDADAAPFSVPVLRQLTVAPPSDAPALPVQRRSEAGAGDDTATAVSYDWVGASARFAGTIVHRWLQHLARGTGEVDVTDRQAVQEITTNWAGRLGVSDDDTATVCDRVLQALDNVQADERGRWLLNGEGESELPLSGLVDGRIQSIVIDRMRVDDDGVHWIVDYKTSTHEGGDLEGFLRQETDRHRAQLEKYVAVYRMLHDVPVRAALYFPLLQAFCEIDLSG